VSVIVPTSSLSLVRPGVGSCIDGVLILPLFLSFIIIITLTLSSLLCRFLCLCLVARVVLKGGC
jgi:hypothetical protein